MSRMLQTFSPMNMPSLVTALTVASTITWRTMDSYQSTHSIIFTFCFFLSFFLNNEFTSLSSSKSVAFWRITGAGGENSVGGGLITNFWRSTQPSSPNDVNQFTTLPYFLSFLLRMDISSLECAGCNAGHSREATAEMVWPGAWTKRLP